jgi:hypothetical protein
MLEQIVHPYISGCNSVVGQMSNGTNVCRLNANRAFVEWTSINLAQVISPKMFRCINVGTNCKFL